MKLHKIFVYGTLREDKKATHFLTRHAMFDTGPYPYITPSEGYGIDSVVGVIIEVDDDGLAALDKYEGVSKGLYVREKKLVISLDQDGEDHYAWVYVAGPVWPKLIPSGDWTQRGKEMK